MWNKFYQYQGLEKLYEEDFTPRSERNTRLFSRSDRNCRFQDRKAVGKANRKIAEARYIFCLVSRLPGRKEKWDPIMPNGKIKAILDTSIPDSLSESGARHPLISQTRH